MAPSITETVSHTSDKLHEKLVSPSLGGKNPVTLLSRDSGYRTPLKLSGALDHVKSFDVTPVIGREFEGVDLASWLRAPNSDELLRDLAITSTTSETAGAKAEAN
jgi:hypothetical protein